MKPANFLSILILAAVVVMNPRAEAVIRVDLPVSKRYESSKSVVLAKITRVAADKLVIEAITTETLKGDAGPAAFRINLRKMPELVKSATAGEPVIILVGYSTVVIHVADTWVRAAPIPPSPAPIWTPFQMDPTGHSDFPGSTSALVSVVRELKAGKSTLLDAFTGKPFPGGIKEITKLNIAKPTFLLAADVNGDGKPDLIIGTPQGVKLYLASADGYADATEKWGLTGATGVSAAAGDVNGDGKIDLLIDKTLYLNDGQKFAAAPQKIAIDGNSPVLTSALIDVTGGGKLDAAFILGDGRLLIFKNSGQPTTPWLKDADRKLTLAGPAPQTAIFGNFFNETQPAVLIAQENGLVLYPLKAEQPPADFYHFTGSPLDKMKGFAAGLKNAVITRVEINGDHRPDLLITADGATLILINRGFGCFLADPDAAGEMITSGGKALPVPLGAIRSRAAIKSTAGDAEDLLLLADDGRLFLLGSAAAGSH